MKERLANKMNTYKLVSVTDKNGEDKVEWYAELKASHPEMTGEIVYEEALREGLHLVFLWSDTSHKWLRTTALEKYTNLNNTVVAITKNSIYKFEKVEENKGHLA